MTVVASISIVGDTAINRRFMFSPAFQCRDKQIQNKIGSAGFKPGGTHLGRARYPGNELPG